MTGVKSQFYTHNARFRDSYNNSIQLSLIRLWFPVLWTGDLRFKYLVIKFYWLNTIDQFTSNHCRSIVLNQSLRGNDANS